MHLSKYCPSNHCIVSASLKHLQLFWFVSGACLYIEDYLAVSITLMSRKQHVIHVLISPHPIHNKKIFRPTLKVRTKIWPSQGKVHHCNLPHKSFFVVCHRLILFWIQAEVPQTTPRLERARPFPSKKTQVAISPTDISRKKRAASNIS